MLYIDAIMWDLLLSLGLVLFVAIFFVLGIFKYKKIMRNKTVGIHDKLHAAKLNLEVKVNDFDRGYHIYADKEMKKWAIIFDNPKSCDIFNFDSLEEYVLTIDGEAITRCSNKELITELKEKRVTFVSLDIFTKNNKYRFIISDKEHKITDQAFKNRYDLANSFCDILDYIIYYK